MQMHASLKKIRLAFKLFRLGSHVGFQILDSGRAVALEYYKTYPCAFHNM